MKKLTKKKELEFLRQRFTYDITGKPVAHSYGVFKGGFASSEIDDYLRAYVNKWDVIALRKKLNNSLAGGTCAVAIFNGLEITLTYRHDVERHIGAIVDNIPTYWD